MNDFYIKALPHSASSTAAFPEATAEELRVLIAAIELNGTKTSLSAVAARAGTSIPRTKASLRLWESEGALAFSETPNNIIDEFEPAEDTVEAKKTAATIRSEGLRTLHEEIARIIEKPALDREEVNRVTALTTELALSPEYIITLASFLKEKREASGNEAKLRVGNIVNRAKSLAEKGIDTLEMLERHIELTEQDTKDEHEIRTILGIWGRAISKTQKEYFKKWMNDYCFGSDIISEAYDIAALNTKNGSLPYMDRVLTSWHEAGLKTAEECRNYDTARLKEKRDKRSAKKPSKTEPETPKYGNFDPSAAFMAALDRSYSDKK